MFDKIVKLLFLLDELEVFMAKISKDIIIKNAILSRISNDNLTEEQIEKFISELESVLEHVDELNEINTVGIDPIDGWTTNTMNDLREDIANNGTDYEMLKTNIINNFPNKKNNMLVIAGIFNEN